MPDAADILARIGFGYALLAEDARRARAYANAARVVKKFGSGLAEAHSDGSLAATRGIGKSILTVIGLALRGEEVPQLTRLEQTIPAGVFEMRRLRGVGPSKVQLLWQELGVTTIGELEYACSENRLVELPGFGAKTQDKVLESIAELRRKGSRARMDRAQTIAAELCAALRADPGVRRAEIVGQVRRGTELTDVVEVAVLGVPAGDWPEQIGGLPVSVHACPDEADWGAHLVRTTGSPEHVEALAALGDLAGATEQAVYATLGLTPTEPERREADVPLTPRSAVAPRLVRREDLRGALHNHTTASDGIHSLEEMRAAATRLGLEYLGVSDHSQTAAYAGGLVPQALLEQVARIAELNASDDGGAHLLSGVESDILRDGSLDYEPSVLAGLDLVVASAHNRHRLEPEAATARMVRAARNPWTDVIGHPTGRLLLGRRGVPIDIEALLDACAQAGCAVELNANPHRLDLDARACAMAKERGVPVSIAADAHSSSALSHLEYGVTIARRAGLGPQDVLNCRPLESLLTWLAARKTRALAASSA